MADDIDLTEELYQTRKRVIFGKLNKCTHCGMFNTDTGECPVCHKGKMVPA